MVPSLAETSDPSDSVSLTANFTFVARDSTTGKSALINQISPETEKEKLLWKEAEERNRMRKKKKQEPKREIDNEEVNRLNELLSEGRIFCDMPALADRDSILIKDTCLQNSLICQPQQRNIHGRIFGGFLMRRAFELAFATAYAFAGSAPCFLEVDHVDFLKPVSRYLAAFLLCDAHIINCGPKNICDFCLSKKHLRLRTMVVTELKFVRLFFSSSLLSNFFSADTG